MSAPSRRRDAAPAAIAALLLGGCLPDFGSFQLVEEEVDAGMDEDAALPPDGGVDAGADGGMEPSAIDFECGTRWTELTPASEMPCGGRQIVSVVSSVVSGDVALARARDGTLTVVYNDAASADSGRVRTLRFHESAPDVSTAGPNIDPTLEIGENVGIALAVATQAPDIHHLAYWLRSDFGHEVRYRTLRGEDFGNVVTLATAVSPDGAVAVAVDSDGRAAVAWHDDAAGTNRVRREQPGETWSASINLRTDGDPRLAGPGAFALLAGQDGALHAAYQWSITLAASAPSYSIGTTLSWSSARTLDNTGIANRASGVGVDLAQVGDEMVVAYLDWEGGVGEIRLARFRSSDVEPMVTRHLDGVVIPDLPGSHPIVLRADALGRLHLLLADASALGTLLEYHRQTSVAGELRWIADPVALIDAAPEDVRVDMVLGPDRRPHIVYYDPERGELRYATIVP